MEIKFWYKAKERIGPVFFFLNEKKHAVFPSSSCISKFNYMNLKSNIYCGWISKKTSRELVRVKDAFISAQPGYFFFGNMIY